MSRARNVANGRRLCENSCACSRGPIFTRVAARTLARSPICDQLHRRLQPFRYLHDCSGCFRLERSPGGALTHWKAPPSHGARVKRTLLTGAFEASSGRRADLYGRPTTFGAAPKGAFNLTMRLYGPKSEALTGKWNPPAVTRI